MAPPHFTLQPVGFKILLEYDWRRKYRNHLQAHKTWKLKLKQLTSKYEEKNPRNENGTNPIHNAVYWSSFQNNRRILGYLQAEESMIWPFFLKPAATGLS